ncbi:MAG: M14 family zinc carboxypeptidase [Ignavibacteria bacterium]
MVSNKIKMTFTSFWVSVPVFFTILYFSINGFNLKTESDSIQQPKYSQVRVFAVTQQDENKLTSAGLLIDHADRKEGYFLDAWLSEEEIQMLKNSGVPYQVLVDDWNRYYESQPKMTEAEIQAALQKSYEEDNITHSIYGSMGGYLKFNEVINKLDSMRIEYPNLISQKFSIGNSYENRPMWTVRVSNSPNAPTGRPEVWYHSLIHAREPMAMEQMIYFMYWLLENYNIDPVATYILRYRELYFTPVFNPDGYVYNETQSPNGGGMWRKNRKPCGMSTGIDLNRNYGIYQFWNSTNGGSSTSCGSETYRGLSPFSEPETQNAHNFANSRNFKASLSYHTYGNLLIRPWGWSNSYTPDENIFLEYSLDMTQFNGYRIGRADQLLYNVRGITDDWYYNDSGHTKIIAMTPEVGVGTFWPPQSLILPYAQDNLWPNQYYALIAGPYVYPLSTVFNQQTYSQGQSGNYKVKFRNKGLMTAQNVKVQWIPVNAYITIPVQSYSYASLPTFASDSAAFNFTVSNSAPNNCAVPTTLKILQNDTNLVHTRSVYVLVGNGTLTLADSAENGFGNWTTNQGWAVTTSQFHSPVSSFTDSPFGNYGNNTNNSMTMAGSININAYPVVFLNFWHRYATESGYDYCNVEVSSDNGTTWQTVARYSGTLSTWNQQSFDITSYANSSTALKIRFRLTSDVAVTGDGWYVDDIKLTNYCLGVTGISGNNQIPYRYALEQNYPNPFNPTTTINYQLPKQSFVSIKVFDMLGREAAVLVNSKMDAGYHDVTFDGTNFASGLYFYKIEAGEFIETKKMILVK